MDTEEIIKHLETMKSNHERWVAATLHGIKTNLYPADQDRYVPEQERFIAALRYAIADQKARQRVEEMLANHKGRNPLEKKFVPRLDNIPLSPAKKDPFYAKERGW